MKKLLVTAAHLFVRCAPVRDASKSLTSLTGFHINYFSRFGDGL
jgi:hypothetical protein